MCAQEQDRFWEYHDLLFGVNGSDTSGGLSRPTLDKYAQQLGLDTTRFSACLDSHKYRDYLQALVAEARRAGVSSTPTFFLNGKLIQGLLPFDKTRQEQRIPIASGATVTNTDKIKAGIEVCVSGQANEQRQLASGDISDPPGDDQKLCGVVKKYTPATASQVGELIIEEEVNGFKQIIEAELKKPR